MTTLRNELKSSLTIKIYSKILMEVIFTLVDNMPHYSFSFAIFRLVSFRFAKQNLPSLSTSWKQDSTSRNEDDSMISSPVSTVYARNAWNHDPTFGDETRKKKNSLQLKTLAACGKTRVKMRSLGSLNFLTCHVLSSLIVSRLCSRHIRVIRCYL